MCIVKLTKLREEKTYESYATEFVTVVDIYKEISQDQPQTEENRKWIYRQTRTRPIQTHAHTYVQNGYTIRSSDLSPHI